MSKYKWTIPDRLITEWATIFRVETTVMERYCYSIHLNEIKVLDKYGYITLEDEPIPVPIYLDNDSVVTYKVYKVRSINL